MYDPACETLAEHFLQDEPSTRAPAQRQERVQELAQTIQTAVEMWLEFEAARDADALIEADRLRPRSTRGQHTTAHPWRRRQHPP